LAKQAGRRAPAAKAPRKSAQAVAAARTAGDEPKKSDATRQRVLDAAALVLGREGFAGTKLSDIAAEAQLKIATLYYYYPSREALVEAVMVTGSEHVRQHTQETLANLAPSSTPLDRLCAAVESHIRFVLETSSYTQAVIRNAGQVPEHIRESLRQEFAQYGHLWQDLVDEAAEGTQFRTRAQRKTLRLLIIGGLNWTVEWWNSSQAPLDDVVATAVMLTKAALRRD
jgi:AcrR family transcriptional regulator